MDNKYKVVSVRFTTLEYKKLLELSGAEKLSSYIKGVLFYKPTNKPQPAKDEFNPYDGWTLVYDGWSEEFNSDVKSIKDPTMKREVVLTPGDKYYDLF